MRAILTFIFHFMNKTHFFKLTAMSILLVGGAFVVKDYLNYQPDDWITYEDTENGYSVKYPQGLVVQKMGNSLRIDSPDYTVSSSSILISFVWKSNIQIPATHDTTTKNELNPFLREEQIKIDGREGFVAYNNQRGATLNFEDNISMFFVNTLNIDHERVWKSLKFNKVPEKQDYTVVANGTNKTVNNKTLGFKIDVPNEWKVVPVNKFSMFFFDGDGNNQKISIPILTIDVRPPGEGFIPKKDFVPTIDETGINLPSEHKEVTIDGNRALYTHYTEFFSDPETWNLNLYRDGRFYYISTTQSDYEKVWNSFKFLK